MLLSSIRLLTPLFAAGALFGCASHPPPIRLNDNVKLEENLAKMVAATNGHSPIISAPMPRFDSITSVRRGFDSPPTSQSSAYARNAGPYAVMKETHVDTESPGRTWNSYYAWTPGGFAMMGAASALNWEVYGYTQNGARFDPNLVGSRGAITTRQTIDGKPFVVRYEMVVERKIDNAAGFEWLNDALSAIRVNSEVDGKRSSVMTLYSPKLGWTVFNGQQDKGLGDTPFSRVVGAVVNGQQLGLSPQRAAGNPAALLSAATRPAPPVDSANAAPADPLASAPAPPARTAAATTTPGSCPTSIAYIEPQLPVCRNHGQLLEMRRISLQTDVSFREDLAQGFTLRQVALTAAQATQQFDDSMKKAEEAMFSASANAAMARARLDALRASPPRCDADDGARGMGESSYQAYVAMYMASMVNRAVASIAACRARSAQ